MDRWFTIILIFVIPGLLGVFLGIQSLRGKGIKSLYMTDHIYSGQVYIGIPGGIAMLLFALSAVPENTEIQSFLIYAGGLFGILGLVFAATQPTFLKPPWLRWLEREHGDILPLLKEEAHRMGLNVWNEQMQTQADLEEWVAEVREKYGRKTTAN